ncbi:P-loop NTPase [Chlorogloeopsis sp. ULAP02]|uniref:P-loop NTPase n=1 Tax=Chlorogloeopsis sp. ULAP02 TaxID=3107926 RepID=UPI0031358F74
MGRIRLFIDLPPGTGDAQITIIQESPICGVILVTTPQQVAIADVRRNIHMFRQGGVPVLGIIENMSYLICGDCGSRTPIFGSDGGEQLAAELQAPLLEQIHIDARICQGGDIGSPIVMSDRTTIHEISKIYNFPKVQMQQSNKQGSAKDKHLFSFFQIPPNLKAISE